MICWLIEKDKKQIINAQGWMIKLSQKGNYKLNNNTVENVPYSTMATVICHSNMPICFPLK